jgi:hypothetical protein
MIPVTMPTALNLAQYEKLALSYVEFGRKGDFLLFETHCRAYQFLMQSFHYHHLKMLYAIKY